MQESLPHVAEDRCVEGWPDDQAGSQERCGEQDEDDGEGHSGGLWAVDRQRRWCF